MRHIDENYCGRTVKRLERIVLSLMIFFLVVFEAVIAVLPQMGMAPEDFPFLAAFGAIYLMTMTFVLYPGRCPLHAPQDHGLEEHDERAPYESAPRF